MNAQTLVAALEAGKAKIDTPEKWTQGTLARKADGTNCATRDEDAVCFCSLGALGDAEFGNAIRALNRAAGDINNIVHFNDTKGRTHAEVMAVWDKAIAKAEAQAVVENLEAAKAKIDTPEKWTQGYYAKSAEGCHVEADSPNATCFCAFGAIEAVTGVNYGNAGDTFPTYAAINKASKFVTGKDDWTAAASNYNDDEGRTHADIMALFDKAIALAKEAAQ